MSAIGLDTGHIEEHWSAAGLCQCPCADCTTRLTHFCVCLECPCDHAVGDHATERVGEDGNGN